MGDNKAETVLMETKGESAATDTYFLQSLGNNSGHPQWRFDDFGPIPAIALSTDGLRYKITSFKDGYAAYPNLFEKLWEHLEAGKLSRRSLEKWLRTKASQDDPPGDDKTLLLSIRKNAASMSGETGLDILSDCSPRPGDPEPASAPRDPEPNTDATVEASITYDSSRTYRTQQERKRETVFKKILRFFLKKIFNLFESLRSYAFNNNFSEYTERPQDGSTHPPYLRVGDEVSRSQYDATKQASATSSCLPTERDQFRSAHATHVTKGSASSVSQLHRPTSTNQPVSAIKERRPRRPRPPRRITSNGGNGDFLTEPDGIA